MKQINQNTYTDLYNKHIFTLDNILSHDECSTLIEKANNNIDSNNISLDLLNNSLNNYSNKLQNFYTDSTTN